MFDRLLADLLDSRFKGLGSLKFFKRDSNTNAFLKISENRFFSRTPPVAVSEAQ